MKPNAGDVIQGKYRIVRLIGDGGMGSVYEARHEYLGIQVALKFLHPELARRPGLVTRFLREGQVAASIKSPHITQVLDVDRTQEGSAYLVMELLEGESLQRQLERMGRLPLEVALDYTLQMLAGLEVAHAAGVVHRDLKPDNVFVVPFPAGPLVKILDFGIAKLHQAGGLTRPGALMGTPEYMAPEQADSADRVDLRADVFAVGAMLYEMLAGQRPTRGGDARQIAAMVRAQGIVPLHQLDPAIPEGLSFAVHRALAADPEARFATVGELRAALLPHCGTLSPAGRLAATPTPPIVGTPQALGGVGAFPKRGVPRTLPPEEPSVAKVSSTLSDSKEAGAHPSTAAMPAFPQFGVAGPHADGTRPMPAFAAPPHQPHHQPHHQPPQPGPSSYYAQLPVSPEVQVKLPSRPAPPRKRPRSGLSLGLWATGAGAVVALVVLGVLAMQSSSDETSPLPPVPAAPATVVNPTPPAPPAPSPEPTILPPTPSTLPAGPATTRPKPAPAPTTTTPPKPAPAPTPPPGEVDAGAPDAGPKAPRPYPTEIALPPGLPPGLPTAIPIPEGLPPLPFPIPGFPAPAPSAPPSEL